MTDITSDLLCQRSRKRYVIVQTTIDVDYPHHSSEQISSFSNKFRRIFQNVEFSCENDELAGYGHLLMMGDKLLIDVYPIYHHICIIIVIDVIIKYYNYVVL